jgi:ribose transport system substrate-binding protein
MVSRYLGSRSRVHMLVVGVLGAAALAVAACGSDDNGDGGSVTGSSSQSLDLAPFQNKLGEAMKSQTSWQGPTEPVTPPKDFRLAVVTCYSILHGCVSPGIGAQHAAQALGWDFSIYDGKGDPTVWSQRIDQALTNGADAIITVAVNGAAVKGALARAKKAGVPVISTSNATAPGEQGFRLDTSPNLEALGRAIADWYIVDSEGKGVITPWLDKEFQSNISTEDGLQEELKLCTTCTVKSTENFVSTDVPNNLGPSTAAYLRQNPDVNYVYASYDPAATVQVPAILQAGQGDKVKLCSILGDAQNLKYIADGKVQACDGAWDNEYEGWATVDQIIRLVTNKPLHVSKGVPERFKYGENIPYVLLDKDNLPEGDKDWTAPFDYISEYKKLWGLQ